VADVHHLAFRILWRYFAEARLMKRRDFIHFSLAATVGTPLAAAFEGMRFDTAASILEKATSSGQIRASALHVVQRETTVARSFGPGVNENSMFLLGSISKPICITALMTLYDRKEFQLDDRVSKFIPAFADGEKGRVTIQHLLTHVSGLPDQLAENNALRKKHAGLPEFIDHAKRTPLLFAPGQQYGYSSMGILLATHIAELISGTTILKLVEQSVFEPLEMKHSAQGLGNFSLDQMVACQTEHAAPESGAGDPSAKDWDWNSLYWRSLGAPWGGTHTSASDLSKFFAEFLHRRGQIVKPETAKLMTTNQNSKGLTARGLGFNAGAASGSAGCSKETFGHTGSTGTVAWADPASETICIVLTSLPGRAVDPHPRELAGASVAAAAH